MKAAQQAIIDHLFAVDPDEQVPELVTFAEGAFKGLAFALGPEAAAQIAYRLADLLATGGGK